MANPTSIQVLDAVRKKSATEAGHGQLIDGRNAYRLSDGILMVARSIAGHAATDAETTWAPVNFGALPDREKVYCRCIKQALEAQVGLS
jgi:hypothetical protein